MAETVYVKLNQYGKLAATDPMSEELLRGFAGKEIKAVLTVPRNLKHHKKYFALLALVFKTQEHFKNPEHMRKAIQHHLGFYEIITLKNGQEIHAPTSINFAKMDQTEFEALFNRVLDFVAKEIIPGCDKADLVRELEEFM